LSLLASLIIKNKILELVNPPETLQRTIEVTCISKVLNPNGEHLTNLFLQDLGSLLRGKLLLEQYFFLWRLDLLWSFSFPHQHENIIVFYFEIVWILVYLLCVFVEKLERVDGLTLMNFPLKRIFYLLTGTIVREYNIPKKVSNVSSVSKSISLKTYFPHFTRTLNILFILYFKFNWLLKMDFRGLDCFEKLFW